MTQQQRCFKNVLNGHAESTTLSDFQFENQRRTFDSFGYALDPSAGEHATPQIVGDQDSAEINQGMTFFETSKKRPGERPREDRNNAAAAGDQSVEDEESEDVNQDVTTVETNKRRKKIKNNDAGDVEGFHGPWAPYVNEITESRPSEVCLIQ